MIGSYVGSYIGGYPLNDEAPPTHLTIFAMSGYINPRLAELPRMPSLSFSAVIGTTFSLLIDVEDYGGDLEFATNIELTFVKGEDSCGCSGAFKKDLSSGIVVTGAKQFRVDFLATDTADLEAGKYVFDIEIGQDAAVYSVRNRDFKMGKAVFLQNLSYCG